MTSAARSKGAVKQYARTVSAILLSRQMVLLSAAFRGRTQKGIRDLAKNVNSQSV